MQLRRIPLRLSAILALSLALGACAPVKEPQDTVTDPEISRAQSLMAQQDYLAASSLYQELASRHSGSLALDLRLSAADAALKGNDLATAATLLEQTDQAALSPNQALLRRLLGAELALAQRRADRALQILQQQPPLASQRLDLRQRYQRDLADTYRQLGKLPQAAVALQGLDALQVDLQQRLQTQTEILRTLAALNEQLLQGLQAAPEGGSDGEGWLALALLGKRLDDDPQALQAGIQRWRKRFPDHPAQPEH